MLIVLLAVLGFAAEPSTGPTPVPGTLPPSGAHLHHAVPDVSAHGSVAEAVRAALASKVELPCADLLDLGPTDTVREALVDGTRHAMPPWAPLRAAGCLTELAATDDAALQHVQGLAADADQPGFALAISERLSDLPEARAVQIARKALANPAPALQARLPHRLLQCDHPAVRTLAR